MNPMTDDELVSKFVGNVADRWPERKARDVVDLVWDLESQPDLEGLMEAIGSWLLDAAQAIRL